MDNYHITKKENAWELVKEGAQRASKTASTKAEITEIASEFLQGKTASLKIHKEDVNRPGFPRHLFALN